MIIKANTSYLCEEQKNNNEIRIAELENELILLREGYSNSHIQFRKNELVQVNVLAVTDKSIKISTGDDISYGTWIKLSYFNSRYIIFETLGEIDLHKNKISINSKFPH